MIYLMWLKVVVAGMIVGYVPIGSYGNVEKCEYELAKSQESDLFPGGLCLPLEQDPRPQEYQP